MLVGARAQDQPLHGFDAPALRNEFAGEPIEKFGMRRSRAARAEIAWRGHETPTEMMLPEAVDQDAGGERVGRTGKPVGQRRSPARGSRPEENPSLNEGDMRRTNWRNGVLECWSIGFSS